MAYASNDPRFCSGMMNRYAMDHIAIAGRAYHTLCVLIALTNFGKDRPWCPRGTVAGWSMKRLAEKAQLSESTLASHIRHLRTAGLITVQTRTCRTGGNLTNLVYFSGFIDWLSSPRSAADELPDDQNDAAEGSSAERGRPGCDRLTTGGGDRETPIQEEKINNLSGQFLDLTSEAPISDTEVGDLIRSMKPIENGHPVDPEDLWRRFRSWNIRKGHRRLPIEALKGLIQKCFSSRSDQRQSANTMPSRRARAACPAPAQPAGPALAFDLSSAFGRLCAEVAEKSRSAFDLWIAPLRPEATDKGLTRLIAPSAFHASYVRNHYGDALRSFSISGDELVITA